MKYLKIVAFFEKKSNSDLPSIWYFYRVNEFRPNTVEPWSVLSVLKKGQKLREENKTDRIKRQVKTVNIKL